MNVTPAAGAAALTEKPIELDVAEPETEAAAVSVAAPPAVELAAFRPMVAMPEELVSAVPVEGLRDAMVASTLKVTTTLGTGAPLAFKTVAFTVAGVLVVVDPVVGSVRAIAILGVPTVVVVVVLEVVPEDVDATPLPPQLTNKAVIAANIKADKDLA